MLKSFQEAFFLDIIDILAVGDEISESLNGLIPVGFLGSVLPWVFFGPNFLVQFIEPFVNIRVKIEFEIFITTFKDFLCNFQILDIGPLWRWKSNFINKIVNSLLHWALSHAGLEFLKKFGSFLFPLIIDVSFTLKSDDGNWGDQSGLTDQFTLLSKEAWNFWDEAENESDLLSWLYWLLGVMTEKLWLDVFDCTWIYLRFVLEFPLVVNRRRSDVLEFELSGLDEVKFLLKGQKERVDRKLRTVNWDVGGFLFKILVILCVTIFLKEAVIVLDGLNTRIIVAAVNVDVELRGFIFLLFVFLRSFLFHGRGYSLPEMVDFFNPGCVGIVHLSYTIKYER